MYLAIDSDGVLSLEDIDDMKRFSIVVSSETIDVDSALLNIAEATEDNHYWLDTNTVIKLSAKADDAGWVDNFWNMLKAVEAYGYSDLKNERVKAHVEIKKAPA